MPERECHACLTLRPEYSNYDFGPQHPLRPERIRASLDLMQQLDLAGPVSVGALSIVIAFFAKLVFRDDIQNARGSL